MVMILPEDTQYKHDDYAVRNNDAYALSKYQIILNWLPNFDGLRVLNAGCGSGEMTALLAKNPTWHVDAFDVDAEAIALSRAMKEELNLQNVTIYEAGIESFTGKNYDIVVCNDVLEHLPDPVNAVSHLTKMLKSGGVLCVSVPALQWLFGYHDQLLGHYRRYNRKMLINLLSPHMKVTHCRYFGFTLIPIAVWYSLLRKKNYPVSESTGVSFKARILNSFLSMERSIPFPIGTSLLAFGVAPE